MAQSVSSRTDDVREVLINAVEVELAALKAAVSFWKQWIEHTSKYVKTTSKTLSTIRTTNKDIKEVLLEVVDAGRETMRLMTELPRKSAEGFLRELDAFDQKRAAPARPRAKRRARAKP